MQNSSSVYLRLVALWSFGIW